MSSASDQQRLREYDSFKEEANKFFEAQLERLGLGSEQIQNQNLVDLNDSLARVDDALRAPESFGVLRLRATGATQIWVVTTVNEAHLEVGIVPLLLERKRAIIERLRMLRSQRPITTLDELVDSIEDVGLRERLRTELEAKKQVVMTSRSAGAVKTNQAFVAMAMDPNNPQLEDVLDAIKEGSNRCGVLAERIDEAISNEPITARMLKSIEESEFVIVDISHARTNVYYEAGYAQGLGKTPVYLAQKGTEVPFDVRDYPVIVYPNMRELKTSLAERLSAVRAGRK
jgi:hypothetical protein